MYATPTSLDDFPEIPVCSCCPRELHDADYGRLACWKCEERMYGQLNDVGAYWAKLPDSAHRPVGERSDGRSASVHPGIPGNSNVINLTAGGDKTPLGQLLAVEDDWRRAHGFRLRENYGRPVVAMPKVLAFLRRHLPWACGAHKNPPLLEDDSPLLPDVQALNGALGPIVADLRFAASGDPKPRLVLSRCLAPYVAGFACAGQVRVGVSVEPRQCSECGTPWDRETWMRWAREANQFGAAA